MHLANLPFSGSFPRRSRRPRKCRLLTEFPKKVGFVRMKRTFVSVQNKQKTVGTYCFFRVKAKKSAEMFDFFA
jgi:hypothetical protein